MVCRQRPRVDAHDDIRRSVRQRQVVTKVGGEWREAPVEADHEGRSVPMLELGPELRELALIQAKRLLDQDGLPGAHRRERQMAVKVVPRCHDDSVDRFVLDELLDRARAAPETELLRG